MAGDAHDRTRRMAEQLGVTGSLDALASIRVAIELSPQAAQDGVAVQAFLAAVNLATRLGPYLPHLDVKSPPRPPVDSVPELVGQTLAEQTLKLAREATDTAELHRGHADDQSYDLVLSIGEPSLPAKQYLPVYWQGWRAEAGPISQAHRDTPRGEMLAGLVAAALGVTKLMGYMARITKPDLDVDNTQWRLNVLSLDDSEFSILPQSFPSLPPLLLLGAGAIAINMAYAARFVPGLVREGIDLDKDHITDTNANRHTTVLYAQAQAGTVAKAPHLAQYLPLTPVEDKYDEWKATKKRSAGDFSLLLTTVDNIEARRSAMSDLPRVTLDAATGGHSITLMRAADPAEACGLCAYPQPASAADPTGRGCGNASVAPELPGASVSYVSALAGYLLTGQMIMEAVGKPTLAPGAHIWHWDDLLGPPPGANGLRARRITACLARHKLFSQIYKQRWSQGTP